MASGRVRATMSPSETDAAPVTDGDRGSASCRDDQALSAVLTTSLASAWMAARCSADFRLSA